MKLAYAALAATVVMVTGPRADAQETASRLFLAADRDRDGALTRAELQATLESWASVAPEELAEALERALPRLPQNQTPKPADVQAMVAALPKTGAGEAAPPAPRAGPREGGRLRALVDPAGRAHHRGDGAEDGRLVDRRSPTMRPTSTRRTSRNTTRSSWPAPPGSSWTIPEDAAATAARRKALLDFVRGGKGLAGIHAASDSYHRNAPVPGAPRGAAWGPAATLSKELLAQGDKNGDRRLAREEVRALADAWYDKVDPQKAGRVDKAAFPQRFDAVLPPPTPSSPQLLGATGFPVQARATQLGPDTQIGTWPEFNRLLGGFFKFHWNDGQVITVKVDEPDHPLNAPFKGQTPLRVIDETYTFGRDTYSRRNVRVLTSVDYAAMSAEDKAKEQYPRSDGDYALSWIRAEGKGRVFYEAHGHNEKVYAITPLLAHLLYGMQYVLGDLEADDRPR